MAGQSIDSAFAAIIKDCQTIAVEAVKKAAKKTQDDIIKEAKTYLQKYYSNYKPKIYKRTDRLRRAILPYWADKSGKNGTSIEVGVQYDSGALKGAYKSNSWYHQDGDTWRSVVDGQGFGTENGIPEPDWILNNFLEGIHPWAQTDSNSTDSLMRRFFDTQLPNRIEQYVQNELFNAITSRL